MTIRAFLAASIIAGACLTNFRQRTPRTSAADSQRHGGGRQRTPASGPKDIVVEKNRIADVIALDPVSLGRGARRPRRRMR